MNFYMGLNASGSILYYLKEIRSFRRSCLGFPEVHNQVLNSQSNTLARKEIKVFQEVNKEIPFPICYSSFPYPLNLQPSFGQDPPMFSSFLTLTFSLSLHPVSPCHGNRLHAGL